MCVRILQGGVLGVAVGARVPRSRTLPRSLAIAKVASQRHCNSACLLFDAHLI